jgi:hypothetical protein
LFHQWLQIFFHLVKSRRWNGDTVHDLFETVNGNCRASDPNQLRNQYGFILERSTKRQAGQHILSRLSAVARQRVGQGSQFHDLCRPLDFGQMRQECGPTTAQVRWVTALLKSCGFFKQLDRRSISLNEPGDGGLHGGWYRLVG